MVKYEFKDLIDALAEEAADLAKDQKSWVESVHAIEESLYSLSDRLIY